MKTNSKKAFTMIELVFVIVIIGILSAIAIPRLAATRDDATIATASTTLASVRSAISAEKQKRILKGDFTAINDLASTDSSSYAFDTFNKDNGGAGVANDVLQYPTKNCTALGKSNGCWKRNSATQYVFVLPGSLGEATFTLANNKFTCSGSACSKLE